MPELRRGSSIRLRSERGAGTTSARPRRGIHVNSIVSERKSAISIGMSTQFVRSYVEKKCKKRKQSS